MAESTRFSSAIQVGTTALLALATGTAGYFYGNVEVRNGSLIADTSSGATVTIAGGLGSFTSLKDASCQKYGSNYVECYQEEVFTGTGGSKTATTYYDVASILSPYTSSGSLREVRVECDKANISSNISIGVTTATTGSGNELIDRDSMGTGVYLKWSALTGSGTTYGSTAANKTPSFWPPNTYVKLSSSSTFRSNSQCILRVWSSGMYAP